jgi:hypothetical protein
MLTEINAGWSILEKFGNLTGKLSNLIKEESVAARFVRLFESHGVHRNQIPRIFKHGLTVADFVNEEKLNEKLSEDVLEDACKLFAVHREWIDGASSQIYPVHFFYKNIKGFLAFIDN